MTLNIDPLVFWTVERSNVNRRRAAGEPQSLWTNDELLATYRFTNPNVQDDRVSRAIYETITLPFAEQPNLIVALTACRFSNEPEVFEVIAECFFPSFDPEKYVARMAERQAQGLPLERRAYRIPAGKIKGELKAACHTRELFIPLARAVEQIRPKPGDTVNAVFQRLRGFQFLGKGFITAQIVRDLKQIAPLRDAVDWREFVWSGPGSRQCADCLYEYAVEEAIRREDARGDWDDHDELGWRSQFQEIIHLAALRIKEHGIEIDDAASWQNCMCETFKLLKYRSGDFGGARKYTPYGETPMRAPRRAPKSIVTVPDEIKPLAPALPPRPAVHFRRLARRFIVPVGSK